MALPLAVILLQSEMRSLTVLRQRFGVTPDIFLGSRYAVVPDSSTSIESLGDCEGSVRL